MMTETKLPELQIQFPLAKYEPEAGCGKCLGRGTFLHGESVMPCHCIFIEHSFLPVYKEAMNHTIAKIREENPNER